MGFGSEQLLQNKEGKRKVPEYKKKKFTNYLCMLFKNITFEIAHYIL